MKVYFDFRDWWIGYYKGDSHHYVCLLPTLVIRWDRKIDKSEYGIGQFLNVPIRATTAIPPNKAYMIPSGFNTKPIYDEMAKINDGKYEILLINPKVIQELKKIQSWKWKEPGA
jgi:hypothetical protein